MPGRFSHWVWVPVLLSFLLLASAMSGLAAQLPALEQGSRARVDGQIILPGGVQLHRIISFHLSSGDGSVNVFQATTSRGQFRLEELNPEMTYTLTVPGDGVHYETTVVHFDPAEAEFLRVPLRPLRSGAAPALTVSVAAARVPNSHATKRYHKAIAAAQRRQFEEAESLFSQAIAIDPQFLAAHNDLAVLWMDEKRYAEAERLLRKAVAVDAGYVPALLNLGITLAKQHKFAEAIPPLRAALRLDDRLLPAHLNLGIALMETGELAEAERELRRTAGQPWPQEPAVHLALGKLYVRQGQSAKALEQFESYLKAATEGVNAPQVRAAVEQLKKELAQIAP